MHYRIIQAIRIQVQTVDTFRVKVADVVNRHEPTDFRIVVPGLQEVEAGLGIVVVAPVPERVQLRNHAGVIIRHRRLAFAPGVVPIFYHNFTRIVK